MGCEPRQEAQIDYVTLYMPTGENRRLKKEHDATMESGEPMDQTGGIQRR